ncbi:MAG TPA: glycosyltransferase family 4 protein [Jiangellaceae bacterium]|nr:glycosyltransferase family 4 protein [Jiangellaceae bacterium]
MPRNAPAAASVGARHLGRDRMHAALVALRALPPGVRRWVATRLRGHHLPVLAVLAMAADGRHEEALSALDDAAEGASPRRLRRLVAAAAALDAPSLATRLLAELGETDRDRHRLEALVAEREGNLIRDEPATRRANRLRRRLDGELAAFGAAHGRSSDRAGDRRLVPRLGSVLHLVTNALPEVTAGYTVRTHGIAAAQRAIGLDAHVATRLGFPVTAGHLGAARSVEVDGVPYHRIVPFRWLPATDDRALRLDIDQTAKLVTRLRPAVLHAHSKHINAQVALALADRFGLPVVYEVRGFLEETWRSRGHDSHADRYRLARQAETRCMSAADAVVTLAETMKAEIVGRGIDPARVTVIPNAVDHGFLDRAPDPGPTRRRLGFLADDVVVGLVTTVNPYEGIETLLEAVSTLHGRGEPVRVLVVGGGPALAGLRGRATDLGLGETAVFTGPVPFADIRSYYAAIDVFCVPRADTPVTRLVTPLKPLEAMATGRPVVASDLAPLREIVDPGRTGMLATPGDPTSLAGAIEPLLYDATSRSRMGVAARQWIAEHRTWTAAANRYRDLYRRLGDV